MCYQDNKERLQKKAHERYQSLSKEEKEEKNNNMMVRDTKIYQNMKEKNWLSIEKNIMKWGKMPNYKYQKPFLFRKSGVFLGLG